MKKHLPARRSAFSLIELVVVIAIIAIIATFTVPAATGILRGSAITQASQTLTDQISLARQMALSRNRAVEVRFYQYADPEAPGEKVGSPATGQWRGMQLFDVLESGVPVPIDKPQRLPISVIMNPGTTSATTLSSLIACAAPNSPTIKTPGTTDPDLPRGVAKNYNYVAFRFLQDGSTNLLASQAGGWFVTIHNMTPPVTGTTPPANFFTLQIDPVSGSIKGFRPTAG